VQRHDKPVSAYGGGYAARKSGSEYPASAGTWLDSETAGRRGHDRRVDASDPNDAALLAWSRGYPRVPIWPTASSLRNQ